MDDVERCDICQAVPDHGGEFVASLVGRDQDDTIAPGFLKAVQLGSCFVGHDRPRPGVVAGDPQPSHPSIGMAREGEDSWRRSEPATALDPRSDGPGTHPGRKCLLAGERAVLQAREMIDGPIEVRHT